MTRHTIEELLGGDEPIVSYGSRKLKTITRSQQQSLPAPPPYHMPVGISWLAAAFRMDRATAHKRLESCPAAAQGTNGQRLYDFVEAASYLVKPKMDFDAVMRSVRREDLPPFLQKTYWDAKNGELRYSRQAGDMWHTQDVVDALGEAFTHLKTSIQLFPETLERTAGLNEEQRKILTQLTDALQDEMHSKLVGMSKSRKTESVLNSPYIGEDYEDET